MVEQEMASIIKFVIDQAGKPTPYYWNVPAHFFVPSIYFPMPEIDTGGETFCMYFVDYTWYIKLFHQTKEEAYSLGYAVVTAIREARNLIPLIAEDGNEMKRNWVRVNDPKLKLLDDGAAQLTLGWRSRKPYQSDDAERSQSFYYDIFMKSGKEISDAYAKDLESYAISLKEVNDGNK